MMVATALLGKTRQFLSSWLDPSAADPWKGSEDSRIAAFRQQLDGIAADLSEGEEVVSTRFDVRTGFVELVVEKDVIARVCLSDRFGDGVRMIVIPLTVPPHCKRLFNEAFSPLTVMFETSAHQWFA